VHSPPNDEIIGNVDVSTVAALVWKDTVGAISEFLVRKQLPSFTLSSSSHIDAINNSNSVAISTFALVMNRSAHSCTMVCVEVLSANLADTIFQFNCLIGRDHPTGDGIFLWTPSLDVVEMGSCEFFLVESNKLSIGVHSVGCSWIFVVFFHYLDVALSNNPAIVCHLR
jgi:hypothetical protein